MTSLFESQVRESRQAIPWAEVELSAFMSDLALSQAGENSTKAALEVFYRPSVASRLWWTFTWTGADGEEHSMQAQTVELCLWRAAVREKQLRKKAGS